MSNLKACNDHVDSVGIELVPKSEIKPALTDQSIKRQFLPFNFQRAVEGNWKSDGGVSTCRRQNKVADSREDLPQLERGVRHSRVECRSVCERCQRPYWRLSKSEVKTAGKGL